MDAQKFIRLKDIYIKLDKIEFFYFVPEECTLYIGLKNNYFEIELDPEVDDIKAILSKMNSLFNYELIDVLL